jgi:hypothetical protein
MPADYRKRRRSGSPEDRDHRYGDHFGERWNHFIRRWLTRGEFNRAVAPLIKQLTTYDQLRRQLEEYGGSLNLPVKIISTLKAPFLVHGSSGAHKVALSDQGSLRPMLRDFGEYDCSLQVRRRKTGMPVYYLCRTHEDYRGAYSLILEDLYQSPGYPMFGERFVKIMRSGHEVYYLRLSMFREKVLAMLGKKDGDSAHDEVDEILEDLGLRVFQAAWHEDQHIGMAAAERFGLPFFRQAIELLYLCLSGDLCELRQSVTPGMLQFFEEVYSQPAIRDFLGLLNHLDGEALARVPQTALRLYPRLSQDFAEFLKVDVPWGRQEAPLYKLLFANFSRLETVHEAVGRRRKLKKAARVLEGKSQAIINTLFKDAKDPGQPHDQDLELREVARG